MYIVYYLCVTEPDLDLATVGIASIDVTRIQAIIQDSLRSPVASLQFFDLLRAAQKSGLFDLVL